MIFSAIFPYPKQNTAKFLVFMEIYKRFVEKPGNPIGLYKSIGFMKNIPYHFNKYCHGEGVIK